jgi:hypothetical protein
VWVDESYLRRELVSLKYTKKGLRIPHYALLFYHSLVEKNKTSYTMIVIISTQGLKVPPPSFFLQAPFI